jgi:hypothetical protein
MSAVLQFPGVPARQEAASLNLTAGEVIAATGGYVRAADQLRELHARGFTRAFRRNGGGPVILERAHYEAVTRGQFGAPPPANARDAAPAEQQEPAKPNRAGFLAKYGKRGKS